jgi:hypothetical protein
MEKRGKSKTNGQDRQDERKGGTEKNNDEQKKAEMVSRFSVGASAEGGEGT